MGEKFTSAFKLDDDSVPLQLHTVVRHQAGDHTLLEFVDLSAADRLLLRSFINERSGSIPT